MSNYADEPAQRRLTFSADGQLADAHDLEIPAHGQVSVISEIIPAETEILEAAFTDRDVLTLDDQAWAVQQTAGAQNITLVSAGNRFLETALGLLPNLQIKTVAPADYATTEELQNDQTHLTIFDSYIPTGTLPTENIFFIGPLASNSIFSITGNIESPTLRPGDAADPLLAYVDLKEVSILDAARIPLPDWARPVLIDENSGDPLLFVGEIEGSRCSRSGFRSAPL